MKRLFIFFAIFTFILNPAYSQSVLKSTLDDQTGVEVTVYNSQLGLVKDTRQLSLSKGQGELRFMDVASTIQPVTVLVKSLNQPDKFAVLEQNYEYDLMNREKLLEKYVGRDLKIMVMNQYQDRKEIVDAKLLANNQGQIYKIDNEIFLGHPGIAVLPELPDNLIDKPTLAWLYANDSAKSHEIEVSYLASGIGWKADYVLNLAEDDKSLDLMGWVSVDNKSGTTYQDAKLKLVAGDVNRVTNNYPKAARMLRSMSVMEDAAAPQFEGQKFFEYHIYNLQRKTTIKNNQTKQIRFIEASGVKVEKEYLVQPGGNYYGLMHYGTDNKVPVNVYIKFQNAKDNQLGEPLPAGVMRIYKADKEQSLQFVGEDRIQHTPKDEEIRLRLGKAFDIVAERKQLNYRRISNKMHESEWEITLRNHKDEDVVVTIDEGLSGNWKIIKHSHEYEKENAFKIRFNVNVPKDGEVKVTYTVRVGI